MKSAKSKIVTFLIVGATLVLAGIAVFTAIRLYTLRNQPVAPTAPESEPSAAASGTTLSDENFEIEVIDVGPGNYESQLCGADGKDTEAKSVGSDTLTQEYKITNKTSDNYELTLIAFPYKIYSIFYAAPNNSGVCIDAYTEDEINDFVEGPGQGDVDTAYLKFAQGLHTSIHNIEIATDKDLCAAHVYDNDSILFDPSVGQSRINETPGSLTCEKIGELIPENTYSDAQTLIGNEYLSAPNTINLTPNESTTSSFSITNNTCGFYQ